MLSFPTEEHLIGTWFTDPEDADSLREQGLVKLEFARGGSLVRLVHKKDGDERTELLYRVEGSLLVTRDQAEPKEIEVPFRLTPDGRLELDLGVRRSRFIRMS